MANGELVNLSGKVTCVDTGVPLINAHVMADGDLIAITNNTGDFNFKSSAEKIFLSVSYVGYQTYEDSVFIKSEAFLSIKLDLNQLDQANVLAETENWVKMEPKAVENFTIYAGKKADIITIDNQLINTGSNNPRQTFSRIAGLNIWETDAGGMQLSIGSRGLDPNRTAHYNVRQNGADISAEPLGYPEAYYTPNLSSVERIEIIRGAASLQYGPQFGGMINFKMKEGSTDKKLKLTAELTSGSFGLKQGYVSAEGGNQKWSYFVSGNYKNGSGWTENSDFNQSALYGGVRLNTSPTSHLKFSVSYMDYLAQQAGGLTDVQFETDPFQSLRNRNWFDVSWLTSSLEWNKKLTDDATFQSRFFMVDASRTAIGFLEAPNRIDTDEDRDIIHGEYVNFGNESRFKWLHQLAKHHATLIAGVRAFSGNTVSQQLTGNSTDSSLTNEEIQNSSPTSDFKFENLNISAFLEEVIFLNKWKFTPGVRYEHISTLHSGNYQEIQTDLAGNILPGYPLTQFENGNNDRGIWLFGLGIERSLSKQASVLFNLTKNYRPVNFSDLYISRPRLAVDPNIKDEQGMSADIEFKLKARKWLNMSVDFYALQYQDKIGTILDTFDDPILGTRLMRLRTNVNDGFSAGIDFNFELDALELFKSANTTWRILPFGSFSYNQSQYLGGKTKYAEITNGNQIEKAPQYQYKLGTRVHKGNLSIELLYSYVGDQFSDATNSTYDATGIVGLIPEYAILDFASSYKYKNFTLSAHLNNALNEVYFARRAAAYPGPGIITSAPRSFGVTLKAQF